MEDATKELAQTVISNNDEEEEILTMPTRIGKPKESNKDDDNESIDSSFNRSTLSDGDGDYISTILTAEQDSALTEEERVSWKAKYQDLTVKRKDFRGAVTYAYDGVLSWSMYSAAEARDVNGSKYTEYLMRLQWGPDWNNMQPWIVARRFREFVSLDNDIRNYYNNSHLNNNNNVSNSGRRLSASLPSLPSRFSNISIFGGDSLDTATIDMRTKKLTEYMTTIITSLPEVLQSPPMDSFLGINERIRQIRRQLVNQAKDLSNNSDNKTSNKSSNNDINGNKSKSHLKSKLPTSSSDISNNNDNSDNNSNIKEDWDYGKVLGELGSKKTIAPGTKAELKAEDDNELKQEFGSVEDASLLVRKLLTSEKADMVLESGIAEIIGLDSEELSRMEEDIVSLASLQREYSARKYLLSTKVHSLLERNNVKWPALRRTCRIDGEDNKSNGPLIARAMQVDEDLTAAAQDFYGLHNAYCTRMNRRSAQQEASER